MARPPKYPWRTIPVGASFLIKNITQAGNAVAQANKWNAPKHFSVKTCHNIVSGERYFRVTRDA